MVLQISTERRTGSSTVPGQEQRVISDGAPSDLMMNPKLAVQCVFASLDPSTASKPSLEDYTV